MDSQNKNTLDLEKVLQILFKRKWLIIICLIVALVPIIIYNRTTRPIYEASTTIVFEDQKGPAASINPFKVSLTKSYITNQIEEIKSRSLAQEVAAALPPGIINTFPLPENRSPNFNITNFIAGQIKKNISATPVVNSEIIVIHVNAYSSIAAKVIANTVAEMLKERNLTVRREETNNVRKIVDEQLVSFKKQLDSAEVALKNFKEQSKVTVIDREAQEIYHRITEAEVSYNQSRANLDAAKKRLDFIQNRLKKERQDLVPSITKITSPWAQKLKDQLVDLEVRYTTLKVQNYDDNHPKMIELQQQIDQTKANLKEESLKIAAGENIVDPITQIQKYMEESIALEIEIETYRAQERTLSEVIQNYKMNLSKLPDKELRLAQLLRDKEVNEKIFTMLLEKREEAKIAEAERLGNIRIIDPAQIPGSPISPRKLLNLIIGFMLGISLGVGCTFILEFMDTSVKTIDDAEAITQLSVLGTIPKIRLNAQKILVPNSNGSNGNKKSDLSVQLITHHNSKSPESEAFRTLRTNLQFSSIDSSLKTILITSSGPSEGKSVIISNLSITTAQMGLKTLLIDADLRKPTINSLFKLRREPGLINMLTKTSTSVFQQKSTENRVQIDMQTTERIIHSNVIANLDILTSGTIPPNPSEILASKAMHEIVENLKPKYDVVFIDSPPINVVTDAGILGNLLDGVVLVLKSGSTNKKEIVRAKELLNKSRGKILGLIINYATARDGYSNYNYYYHYIENNKNNTTTRKRIKLKQSV